MVRINIRKKHYADGFRSLYTSAYQVHLQDAQETTLFRVPQRAIHLPKIFFTLIRKHRYRGI